MRLKVMALCSVGIFCAVAARAAFLQPTAFPRTVDDLSFVDRLLLKSDGYEQFESEYDDNGNCISGCAYAMPKWEDELAAAERRNRMAHQELISEYGYTENADGTLTPPPVTTPNLPYVEFPDHGQPYTPPYNPPTANDSNCANRNSSFANRDIPYGNPLGNMACISSKYGPRNLFGRKFHYGMDFHAVINTPVYAPANGTVKTVFNMNKTCGNGLIIEHGGGYATKYCHFNSVAVSRGDRVSAGCMIGYTGNTGQSTGPHLHYAVLRGGEHIDPLDFIEPGHRMCR